MDRLRAEQLVLFHAGLLDDDISSHPELVASFRPCLCAREESFAELIQAFDSIYADLACHPLVNRELVFALWWICNRARVLVLDPECSVQRESRIDSASSSRIGWWVDVLETASLRALQGMDKQLVLSRLLQYIIAMPPINVKLYTFLESFIQECCCYDDEDVVAEAKLAASVLGFA